MADDIYSKIRCMFDDDGTWSFIAKITKALAREISTDVPAFASWDQIRELCDLATTGNL